MKAVISKDEVQRCVKYCAGSAKRSKAIKFAYEFYANSPRKVTQAVREDVYGAIMNAIDAGVSCGVYSSASRVYLKIAKEV